MKQISLFLMLLLFLNANSQSFSDKENKQLSENNSYLEKTSLTKLHLNLIFTELIKENKFSKNKIAILKNYQVLNNYAFSQNRYSFEVLDKAGIQLNNVNRIIFWRMDLSSDKAHYEFYLSTSEVNTQKLSYLFVLENGKWKLIQN
mgnify:FL=1